MNESSIGLNKYQQLIRWQVLHNSWGWDVIRVFLGVALAVRGIVFLLDPDALVNLAPGTNVSSVSTLVGYTHLIGGILFILGFMTRIAALVQIPIMVKASFFVAAQWGFAASNQSLELSLLVLFLLSLMLVFGAGKRSLDYILFAPDADVA